MEESRSMSMGPYRRPSPEKHDKFRRAFSKNLADFWHILTGFDVIGFDDWLKTPDGVSTYDHITKEYDEDACKLIKSLVHG